MVYNASDWMFNQKPLPIINALNFSPNSRIFDPSNTGTYLTKSKRTNYNSYLNPVDMNPDTAMGLPYFH